MNIVINLLDISDLQNIYHLLTFISVNYCLNLIIDYSFNRIYEFGQHIAALRKKSKGFSKGELGYLGTKGPYWAL